MVIFVLLAVAISLLLVGRYDHEFSQDAWRDNPLERYQMVNTMMESKFLLNKSRQELIAVLGKSDFQYLGNTEHLAYRLGVAPSFYNSDEQVLLITFKEGKSVRVSRINPKDDN